MTVNPASPAAGQHQPTDRGGDGVTSDVDESELARACRAGAVLDCADGDGRRTISARLLRRFCLKRKGRVDPHGIRIRNATVAGTLDLAGVEVPFPLRFEACEFDSAPVFEGAQVHELALTDCPRLPGLLANGLRVRRDLDLSGSHLTGAHRTSASTRTATVWLGESEIGGRVVCFDPVIQPEGGRAVHAHRMRVGGDVQFARGFTASGELRLLGVQVAGSVDLSGATLNSPGGWALELGDATIGGSVFLIDDPTGRRLVVHGLIDLGNARISRRLLIRNATLQEPGAAPLGDGYSRVRQGGTALTAARLHAGAGVSLAGACEVLGSIDLSMSEISSLSIKEGSAVRAAGRIALDLTNAELRSSLTLGRGVTVEGTIRLTGGHIRGGLVLRETRLSAPSDTSLIAAEGVTVDGDVDLRGVQTTGGRLNFRRATLGAVVDVCGARLENGAGQTVTLQQAVVKGSVLLTHGFESVGYVNLIRCAIEGKLDCTDGSFDCRAPSSGNPAGDAIHAISATIRGGLYLGWKRIAPSVDFTNTATTILADDPTHWPASYAVSGLTYDRYEQPRAAGSSRLWDWRRRRDWLHRQVSYDSGPYEQAARVYRQHGYANEAEQILIAQRRQARRAGPARGHILRRALDAIYDGSVGYGYRPSRVLAALAVLLALVTWSLQTDTARATLRASDERGNVYTTTGRLVTADPGSTNASETSASTGSDATSAATRDFATVATGAPVADACGEGQVRCFNPLLYAIDTVVPLVSLQQRSTWYANPHARWGWLVELWLTFATLAGWLLSTIFALSFTRLARAA